MFEGTEVVGGETALVGIVMGSQSDWPTMQFAASTMEALGVPYERHVISAHRTPTRCAAYAEQAQDRGIRAIIAAAGMAAHLPGVIAASTAVPVIGVPMKTSMMGGLDSLLSMGQMPKGIPVATMTIGNHGAINAAVFCARVLAPTYPEISARLESYVEEMARNASSQEPWNE
jgi:5-(carboxyamino)imidazole ribonucleotide mutase